MGKNGYLDRQRAAIGAYRQAEKETYIQYMTDTLILTLNDPHTMGKDVFGEQRIKKIISAWGEMFDTYHGALEKGDEADYFQERLDQRLKGVAGEDFHPFSERYEWVKRQIY